MVDKATLYKLVVQGDGGVGKTALTIQLCLNRFIETYDPTIEDSYRKHVTIDQKACILEVLDTAGQEEYIALQDQWIRDGEGYNGLKMPFIYLHRNMSDKLYEREVSSQEGQALASDLGCEFVETSAKNCINVEKAFYDVVRQLRRQQQSPTKQLGRKDTAHRPSPGMRNNHDSDHRRTYREHSKKRSVKCVIL